MNENKLGIYFWVNNKIEYFDHKYGVTEIFTGLETGGYLVNALCFDIRDGANTGDVYAHQNIWGYYTRTNYPWPNSNGSSLSWVHIPKDQMPKEFLLQLLLLGVL
jgi:hypothetical protein